MRCAGRVRGSMQQLLEYHPKAGDLQVGTRDVPTRICFNKDPWDKDHLQQGSVSTNFRGTRIRGTRIRGNHTVVDRAAFTSYCNVCAGCSFRSVLVAIRA